MRWLFCLGFLVVLSFAVLPALCGPATIAEAETAPAAAVAATAEGEPTADLPSEAPAPAEPSLEAPKTEPVICCLCCDRCDARYDLCVAGCAGDAACIQTCDNRYATCIAGCGGSC